MTNKNNKILLGFLIALFLILILILSFTGCKIEKLGLIKDSNNKAIVSDTGNSSDTSNFKSEKDFFALKAKQKNKNPLNDINVRKAIFYAIDRDSITKELLGDYGETMNSLFNKDSSYYSPSWNIYMFKPEEAKSYLKKAGYDLENPLYLSIGAGNDSPARKKILEHIKSDLEKIGIILWIIDTDSKDWYMNYVKNGNYELGVWALYVPDFRNLKNYFSSEKIPPMESDTNKNCFNYYWYKNTDLDKLIDSGKPGQSKEIQDMLASDAVILPLYNRIFTVAYNNRIKNIDISNSNGSFLNDIEKMDIDTGTGTSDQNSGIKSLIVGYEEEPYSFNPLISDTIYKSYISDLIIKGLWETDRDGNYNSLLVDGISSKGSNMDVEENIKLSLNIDIKLKNNIFWQDGSPITAGDIVETLKAIIRDSAVNNSVYDYRIIKDLRVLNDKEFTVVFNQYDSNWKSLFNIIFPAKIIGSNKISSLFSDNLFGNGPYKLKEWSKGNYILLERNDYYFGEKPKIDNIKFIFNSDINYLVGMAKDGNLDILNIPADLKLMEEIQKTKNLSLLVKQGNLWEHLAICLKPKE